MRSLSNKTQVNRSKSAANSASNARHPRSPAAQFVNNRADAGKTINLQQMTRNSELTSRQTQLHLMANAYLSTQKGLHNNGIVQRVVNLEGAKVTKNAKYFRQRGDAEVLVSAPKARAPEPVSLYGVKDDQDDQVGPVKVWRPRSKLVDKNERARREKIYDQSEELQKTTIDPLVQLTNDIIEEVQIDVENRKGDKGLRLGTAGINDCKGYADTLYFLINKFNNEDSKMVGKMWIHYTIEGAGFPYHAATVVAEDGSDAVTLEAHAGQDITAPVFHIRKGGKAGFENDNKKTKLYEETAQEMRYQQNKIDEQFENLKSGWADSFSRGNASNILVSEPPQDKVVKKTGSNGKYLVLIPILIILIALISQLMSAETK